MKLNTGLKWTNDFISLTKTEIYLGVLNSTNIFWYIFNP